MARKKNADTRRHAILAQGKVRGKKRRGIFFAKVAVQVEVGSQRFDQELSGRVVDEERKVQRFVCNFVPFHILTFALLPDRSVVEEAGLARDGRGYGVRTRSHAIDLDQSHGGAADLGGWCGKQQALAGEQTESGNEKVQTSSNRDGRKNRELVDRDEESKADGHSVSQIVLG